MPTSARGIVVRSEQWAALPARVGGRAATLHLTLSHGSDSGLLDISLAGYKPPCYQQSERIFPIGIISLTPASKAFNFP